MLQDYKERWDLYRFWQPQFIRDNFLLIGYHALRGFATQGKGVTVCDVVPPVADFQPSSDLWQFSTEFIAVDFAASYLLEMGIDSRQIQSLMQTIATYDPQQEIVLAMNIDRQLEIYYLQNLEISPSECYQQVGDRCDEFIPF
jgi:hypothetical protein